MKLFLDRSGTTEAFINLLNKASDTKDIQSLLIFACDENQYPAELERINKVLQAVSQPIIGGVFPEIIHQKENLSRGALIVGLTEKIEVHQVSGLSDETADFEQLLDEKIADDEETETLLVFVDGLASRIGALVDSLFQLFGLEFNYVGGGAGSLSFEQKPCIFTNDGLLTDSAALGFMKNKSGVGVRHGWQSLAGPFQVTEADGPIIKSLNWQPAFDVYRFIVEAASGQSFAEQNFLNLAKAFPFGIHRAGAEKIVRDPISHTEDGTLVCVGEVPLNSYVNILTGSRDSLVAAASEAVSLGQSGYGADKPARATLMIDCISRVLFLEDDFSHELAAVVGDEAMPLFGALTLGEIANQGQEYLAFHNKTAVVAILE